eukprot:g33592.t1
MVGFVTEPYKGPLWGGLVKSAPPVPGENCASCGSETIFVSNSWIDVYNQCTNMSCDKRMNVTVESPALNGTNWK